MSIMIHVTDNLKTRITSQYCGGREEGALVKLTSRSAGRSQDTYHHTASMASLHPPRVQAHPACKKIVINAPTRNQTHVSFFKFSDQFAF